MPCVYLCAVCGLYLPYAVCLPVCGVWPTFALCRVSTRVRCVALLFVLCRMTRWWRAALRLGAKAWRSSSSFQRRGGPLSSSTTFTQASPFIDINLLYNCVFHLPLPLLSFMVPTCPFTGQTHLSSAAVLFQCVVSMCYFNVLFQ